MNDMEHIRMDEQKTIAPSSLSKSWSVASAHVPTFSGGKVTHCHTKGLLNTNTGERVEFLVLPVAGDLALVDAHRGVKIRTLRQGMDGVVTDTLDDDEDEGMDADAITCYALSLEMMKCSLQYLKITFCDNTIWRLHFPGTNRDRLQF